MIATSNDVASERSFSSLGGIKKLLLSNLKIGEAKLLKVPFCSQGNNLFCNLGLANKLKLTLIKTFYLLKLNLKNYQRHCSQGVRKKNA